MLTWVHIGDLHVDEDDGYASAALLEEIVAHVNEHLRRVDFVYLPGDNANHGSKAQYDRILQALKPLKRPFKAIPGDHDREPGSIEAFGELAGGGDLPRSEMHQGHRCLFLDIVSAGTGGPDFRLGDEQMRWLERELVASTADPQRPVVFMHAYPSDLTEASARVADLFARARVAFVDTGHTHYNEVLNDGRVLYAATRSTGQIDEDDGRPGFSIVNLDRGVASWRFHRLGDPWPMVMITAPSDRRFVTSPTVPSQFARPGATVAARVFGPSPKRVSADVDGTPLRLRMSVDDPTVWSAEIARMPGSEAVAIGVTAEGDDWHASDRILAVNADSQRVRAPVDDKHAGRSRVVVEPWPEHGLLGSQRGPNKASRRT